MGSENPSQHMLTHCYELAALSPGQRRTALYTRTPFARSLQTKMIRQQYRAVELPRGTARHPPSAPVNYGTQAWDQNCDCRQRQRLRLYVEQAHLATVRHGGLPGILRDRPPRHLRYLEGLTPADLERCPHPERRPGSTIGNMLSHLIVEGSQHLGQVAYLRGLQRGLEYPTSWVSSRTPWPDSRLQRGR